MSTAHPDDDLECNEEILSFTLKTCTKEAYRRKSLVSIHRIFSFLSVYLPACCVSHRIALNIQQFAVHLTNSFSILLCQCGFVSLDFLRQRFNIKKKVPSFIGRRARRKFIRTSNIDWHGGKKGRGKKIHTKVERRESKRRTINNEYIKPASLRDHFWHDFVDVEKCRSSLISFF